MKTLYRSTEFIAATLLITLLIGTSPVFATTVATPSSYPAGKPYAYVYGTATNTVASGLTPMQYNNGATQTLPFNYSNGALTFPFVNVAFANNLLNASVKGTQLASPTGSLSLSSIQQLTANGVSYTSMQVASASALSASTAYSADFTDTLNPTQPITGSNNIVVTMSITLQTTVSPPTIAPFAVFKVVDTGGSVHNVEVSFGNSFSDTNTAGPTPTTPASSVTVNYATGITTGVASGQAYTVQANLAHILGLVGYTWTPSVLAGITYGVSLTSSVAVAAATSIATVNAYNAFTSP
ncbi:MAG: hypothetical protein JRM82_03775, partial [Nitrososphaerota archaeon]|nr:hypothetical protein [Nitrososphaerota archaeon]